MKARSLITAALMGAAVLYSEQILGDNTLNYQNVVNRNELVMTSNANEQQQSELDISKWVLWNAKMETVASGETCGWLTDVQGGTLRTYVMPTDADINKGDCPYPNAVERWQGQKLTYPANTNLLYQKINLPNGNYTITMWAESQDLGDHTHKGGMFVFANEVQQDITNHCTLQQYMLQVTVSDGTLTFGVKTGDSGSDDNHVVLADVTILADQNIIEGINTENPLDVTGAVKNSSCVAEYGWERDAHNVSALYVVDSRDLDSPDYAGAGIEYWVSKTNPTKSADLIYQNINNLPVGKYRFSAVAMGRDQNDDADICKEGLYLFANDVETSITTNVWGNVTVKGVVLEDGKLRIGLRAGENNNNNWLAISQVKLECIGLGIDAVWDYFHEQAENIDTKALPIAIRSNLIAAMNKENPVSDDVLILKAAIKLANEAIGAYSRYSSRYDQFVRFNNETLAEEKAKTLFSAKLSDLNETVENTLTVSDIEQSYAALLDAAKIYSLSVYGLAEGIEQVDMTFLLTNPDMTDLPGWTELPGWYTDTDKGIQSMHNSEVASEDGKDAFYEIYAGNGTPMPEGQILYQKVTLAPGTYQMSAYAFGKGANGNYVGDFSGCFFAGETKGDAVTAARLTQGTVKFVQVHEQEVKLGLYSDGTGAANWAGIGYMKLYRVAPDALSLSEEDESLGIESDTYGDVTVARNLKADEKWNTFCVPFAMTAEQLADNKIIEVRKLENTVENGGSVVLNFSDPISAIEAGVPYIVKVSEPVSQITVNGAAVKVAAPAPLEVGSVNMQGNYGRMSITGDQYFISDNKFYRAADKNVTVKGFRAYITLDQVSAGVNQMLINIDGNVTAIEDVLDEDVDTTVNVYTIDGVCVKSGVKSSEALDGLRKGIYIVNGKKVVK